MKSLGIILIALMVNIGLTEKSEAALSWFSRANCATLNESISWDPYAYHWLWTYTAHYKMGPLKHKWNTGWKHTWRSYAGHSDGATLGWYVKGRHWKYVPNVGVQELGWTSATDCNLGEW